MIASHTHTHTHTHTLALTHTHTRTRAHTHTHTLTHSLTHTHIHTHTLSHAHAHTRTRTLSHTHTHTHTHTHISSSITNLTVSWYFIKIKYSEPNISGAASVSPLAFNVLLLAVIKQHCIAVGAFWIGGGGELPVFLVRHHAPNRDACTVTVRDEYMYRATPSEYTCL